MSKINPEFKDQWVAALRSGRYTQARNYLRTRGCHCCLGVACDLIDPDAWEMNPFIDSWNGETSTIPDAHAKIIGLESDDQNHLIMMNDTDRCDFRTIADWIEENL